MAGLRTAILHCLSACLIASAPVHAAKIGSAEHKELDADERPAALSSASKHLHAPVARTHAPAAPSAAPRLALTSRWCPVAYPRPCSAPPPVGVSRAPRHASIRARGRWGSPGDEHDA